MLAGMESYRIARLWAAAAWADGTLHPREREALQRFIAASPELGRGTRGATLALLDAKPDVDPSELAELSRDAREGVYRAVLGIVRLDGKVTGDEDAWLAKLREHLDLDEATRARIERER